MIFFITTALIFFLLFPENGISDSVVCGIGRNSYFTGRDQKIGPEYGKELWDMTICVYSQAREIVLHSSSVQPHPRFNHVFLVCFVQSPNSQSWRHCRWLLPPGGGIRSLYPQSGLGFRNRNCRTRFRFFPIDYRYCDR